MQICRSEDGQVFQVNTTLYDIQRTHGSLKLFLQEVTGVNQDSIIAFLSDGQQLREDNLRDLAGAQDQSIFVFNRDYLDLQPDDVIRVLKLEPELQPPIEEDSIANASHLLESYIRAATAHHDFVAHTLTSLHYQHESLRIASTNLDLHVLSLSDAFDQFAQSASKELDRQATLLNGISADLDIIAKLSVHPELLSANAKRGKTLGDYVSRQKMKHVVDTCAKQHTDLVSRFRTSHDEINLLKEGANEVRETVSASRTADIPGVEAGELCTKRSLDSLEHITSIVAGWDDAHPGDLEALLEEVREHDTAIRQDVGLIVDIKNQYTLHLIETLRRVSELQSDIANIPTILSGLESELRVKGGFQHLQRLHQMSYAYGATLVEIVRRKDFNRFFAQRAETLAEVMAKLSANERKKRQVFRGESLPLLPFEVQGMEEQAPTIEISTIGTGELPYKIGREDVAALLTSLRQIESEIIAPEGDPHPVKETRESLERLVTRMDALEADFDRMAERYVLSSSRAAYYRKRSADESFAAAEVQNIRQAMDEEKTKLEEQLTVMRQEVEQRKEAEEALLVRLQEEEKKRVEMEERNAELQEEKERQGNSLAAALSDVTEQAHLAEDLRKDLSKLRKEWEALQRQEGDSGQRVTVLLEEQSKTRKHLEAARLRNEELEDLVRFAKEEVEEAKKGRSEALRERDRLIRDHIAEADGDRAVLEQQFAEMKNKLDPTQQRLSESQQRVQAVEHEIKEAHSKIEMLQADHTGAKEELQRVIHELHASAQLEATLRAELTFANNAILHNEHRLEREEHLLAQALEVAIAFRNSHAKTMASAQGMLRPSAAAAAASALKSGTSMADSLVLPSAAVEAERATSPTPIDPSDPAAALEILREFDLDAFADTIAKTGTTIRKWQKQCKEYRERARGKISFRNFQKGDLALFLPTRNSVAKPWAAFNVSFPHYFLQATGHVAEQLKTREWIVARITSISERVVDSKDPNSNPYGLGDGIKYYMLEVEDWTTNVPAVRGKQRSNTGPPKPSSLLTPLPHDTLKIGSSLTTTRSRSPPPLLPPPTNINTNDPDIAEGITAAPARPRNVTGTSSLAGPSGLSRLLAQANKDSEPSPPSDPGLVPPTSKIPSKLSPPKEKQIAVVSSPVKSLPAVAAAAPTPAATPGPFPSAEPTPLLPVPNLTSPAPLRLSPRNSPRPSPRQRPLSLQIAPGSNGSHTSSPLAGVAITAKDTSRDPLGNVTGAETRRSSNSQVSRPSSVLKHNSSKLVGGRGVFALSTSPTKAVATTAVTITPGGAVVKESESIGNTQTLGSVHGPERPPTATSKGSGTDEDITPSPAESVTEGMLAGMNSILWDTRVSTNSSVDSPNLKIDIDRRRTMSVLPSNTNVSSPSSMAAFNLNRLSMTSSQPTTSGSSGGWFASLPWARKRREREVSEGSSTTVTPARSSSRTRGERVSEVAAGANTSAATDLLKRFETRD